MEDRGLKATYQRFKGSGWKVTDGKKEKGGEVNGRTSLRVSWEKREFHEESEDFPGERGKLNSRPAAGSLHDRQEFQHKSVRDRDRDLFRKARNTYSREIVGHLQSKRCILGFMAFLLKESW